MRKFNRFGLAGGIGLLAFVSGALLLSVSGNLLTNLLNLTNLPGWSILLIALGIGIVGGALTLAFAPKPVAEPTIASEKSPPSFSSLDDERYSLLYYLHHSKETMLFVTHTFAGVTVGPFKGEIAEPMKFAAELLEEEGILKRYTVQSGDRYDLTHTGYMLMRDKSAFNEPPKFKPEADAPVPTPNPAPKYGSFPNKEGTLREERYSLLAYLRKFNSENITCLQMYGGAWKLGPFGGAGKDDIGKRMRFAAETLADEGILRAEKIQGGGVVYWLTARGNAHLQKAEAFELLPRFAF